MRAAITFSLFILGACFTTLPAVVMLAPAPAAAQATGELNDAEGRIVGKVDSASGVAKRVVLSAAVGFFAFVGALFMAGRQESWIRFIQVCIGVFVAAAGYLCVTWVQS